MSAVPSTSIKNRLRPNRASVLTLVVFAIGATTPITVWTGIIVIAYATTPEQIALAWAFPLVGLVLVLFGFGYLAMSRHNPHAGPFYSYIAAGLSKPIGVGAAWVALSAYNLLQVGLYGFVGTAATPLLEQWVGISPPWYVIALVAWLIVAGLGLLKVEIGGRVLAVFLGAEIILIMTIAIALIANPAPGPAPFDALNPLTLFAAGALGVTSVIAFLGFIGFEGVAVYAEEARGPRTVAIALFVTVLGMAFVYGVASVSLVATVGADNIGVVAATQLTALVFNLTATHLGSTMVTVATVVLVTSVFIAMTVFHGIVGRYIYALGRERVLFPFLGHIWRRTGVPARALAVQSLIGLAFIITFAVLDLDPLIYLFYWGGTAGAIGVLFLVTVTSIAVVAYFARHHEENLWRGVIAPGLAAAALLGITWQAVVHIDLLLGVPPNHPMTRVIPWGYAALALAGTGYGLFLMWRRPEIHKNIGLGAKAAIAELDKPERRYDLLPGSARRGELPR